MILNAVDHIVILVAHIEVGIRAWRDGLGFKLSHRVSSDEAGVDVAFFMLADGTFVELIAPSRADSPYAELLAEHGEGLRLLSFRVDDLDVAIEDLAANGVKLRGVGTPQVFIEPESASGILIQLWPKDRPHRWHDELKR